MPRKTQSTDLELVETFSIMNVEISDKIHDKKGHGTPNQK